MDPGAIPKQAGQLAHAGRVRRRQADRGCLPAESSTISTADRCSQSRDQSQHRLAVYRVRRYVGSATLCLKLDAVAKLKALCAWPATSAIPVAAAEEALLAPS